MIRKFFSEETAKLRKMNTADKGWYIWSYYKLPIIIFVLVIAVIASTISVRNANTSTRDYLYIIWLADNSQPEHLRPLSQRLSTIVDEEKQDRYRIAVHSYVFTDDAYINHGLSVRFNALITQGVFDVKILSEDEILVNALTGVLKSIDDVMAYLQSLNPALHDYLLERAWIVTYICPDSDEPIEEKVAISLQGSPLLEELGFDTSQMYFSVIVTSGRHYEIAKALEVLFAT